MRRTITHPSIDALEKGRSARREPPRYFVLDPPLFLVFFSFLFFFFLFLRVLERIEMGKSGQQDSPVGTRYPKKISMPGVVQLGLWRKPLMRNPSSLPSFLEGSSKKPLKQANAEIFFRADQAPIGHQPSKGARRKRRRRGERGCPILLGSARAKEQLRNCTCLDEASVRGKEGLAEDERLQPTLDNH